MLSVLPTTQLMSGRTRIELLGEAPKDVHCMLRIYLWLQVGKNKIQSFPRLNSSCENFRLRLKWLIVGLGTASEKARNIVRGMSCELRF